MHRYVSCIYVDGKPILPPLMDDDRRRAMQQLREEAIAVELRLKERRRAKLMEQVQTILDKCVTLDELNVSKVEPSKYRLITEPLLRTPVRKNTSFSESVKPPLPVTSYSLPSTPTFDEASIENLHKKFLAMKQECKDISISGSSAVSTDLGPYMRHSDSDPSSSESTTPCAISDTDVSTSLECSTPIKSQRMRRLSYTLEAPSPVLLKIMQQNKVTVSEKYTVVNVVPKLNLSNSDDSLKERSHISETNQKENVLPLQSVQQTATPSNRSLNRTFEGSATRSNESSLIIRPVEKEDLINGNSVEKPKTNHSDRPVLEPKKPATEPSRDSNGNTRRTLHDTSRNGSLIEEFLLQQQKLMNDLLEKQAKEQERLVLLFKEQEEQLKRQMQSQASQQHTSFSGSKSPARRSLQQSFDRYAKARNLCDSGNLSALVRGYLTRRLLATDRVQSIIQTIRDTTICLKELNQGDMAILPSDVELHKRLLQQLNGAIHTLHEIFFEWDVSERMLIIARDREKKAGQMIVTGKPIQLRPRSRSLSSATVKSLERKLSRQDSNSRNSSRPSSASTAHPRTSPSSMASSSWGERRRSPSSASSYSTHSVAHNNGSFYTKNKQQPAVKSRKPWRC